MIWPFSLIQEKRQYNQDKQFVDNHYFSIFGENINWNNPKTFNEKIQVFKISKEAEKLWPYVDKVEVRKFIKETLGEEYLIPIVGVFNNANEINFDELPNKFVLKTNHGSGWNIICKDKAKLNWEETTQTINSWLKQNFFHRFRERQYKLIKPKIIVEKYFSKIRNNPDYKFFCFNGKPLYIEVSTDKEKNHKRNFYDLSWKQIPLQLGFPNDPREIPKPPKLKQMIEIAKLLSNKFPHVRVDLYNIGKIIYFSELTFTHANGAQKFIPEKYNLIFGKKFIL